MGAQLPPHGAHEEDWPRVGPEAPIQYVNILQASAIAGVSRRTIYNWLAQGKLSTVRTPGGRIRIDRASLWRPAGVSH